MLGFSFPLYVLGSVQLILSLMLLGPIQTARPVINLAKISKLPVGKTVVATLATLLSLFLFPLLWNVSDSGKRQSLLGSGELGSLRQRCFSYTKTSTPVISGRRPQGHWERNCLICMLLHLSHHCICPRLQSASSPS